MPVPVKTEPTKMLPEDTLLTVHVVPDIDPVNIALGSG